ncbi:response regulator transcription factor [Plantactinospora sp. ZYX-F-223]|uniref:response regulator transcription factor n=1 Tax=Plantactinospora sp. ZYX-F-223 TaxID=3144103 RepID=UPI0031FDEEAE
MIRVLLADDRRLVRAGFRLLLENEVGFEVCAEAADGRETVEAVRTARPDVVVLDIRMPGTDGLTALRLLAADSDLAGTRVLVLTTFDLDEYVFEALRVGASGFLLKDAEPAELLRAIRLVAAGEALLAPSVTRRLIAAFADGRRDGPADETRLTALTTREREVLTLVGGGLTNSEIAERLMVSPATVRTHIGRVLTKLDARDRVQLVILAYETGLVTACHRE